jgi:hypothetical protein
VSGQVISVDLSQRELWLLVGPLEEWITEMEKPDERVGVLDPDREPELQELHELLGKIQVAQAELTNPLAEADTGRHPEPPRPREIPAQATRSDTVGYGTARRKENQLF